VTSSPSPGPPHNKPTASPARPSRFTSRRTDSSSWKIGSLHRAARVVDTYHGPVDKLERVFVSSTYVDLREERQEVLRTLLEAGCIPAGMELFPAADEDAWTLIESVIEGCDYYIVVVGGRYGSVDHEGVSFTEREFPYAEERGLPIMGFLHARPGRLPAEMTELEPEQRQRLESFRARVERRHCKYWSSSAELGGQVARSLIHMRRTHPVVGWVRATEVVSPALREEMTALRDRVAELEALLERSQAGGVDRQDLAQGQDKFHLRMELRFYVGELDFTEHQSRLELSTTWDEAFSAVGPALLVEASEKEMQNRLTSAYEQRAWAQAGIESPASPQAWVKTSSLDEVKVQLYALGLIERSDRQRAVRDTNTYWRLTQAGEARLMALRAARRPTQ